MNRLASWRGGVLAAWVLGGAAVLGAQKPATRPRTLAEDLQLFSQVMNQIRVNHPDSLDSHAALMAAIEGMVRATDPHSFVIPAVRLDSARQRALEAGKLQPVPISFLYSDGTPVVVSVAPGTQAATQNILLGDELIAIEGAPVTAESPDELDIVLAGPKGSQAKLRFARRRPDGTSVTIERQVKREAPEERSAVPAAEMLDATTGYVRITTFSNQKVADDFDNALKKLEKAGMKRLLIDLRDNGGGLVGEAGDIAGVFLEKGAVVYESSGRKADVNKTVKVSRSFWHRERNYPVIVLVNRGTASASELVAGALQDHDRALIVGRPSFGKALLMQMMPLTDGSLMMLVIGHVKTPCGRVVQRQYRGVRHAEYLRDAGSVRDTAGRPSCKTTGGRTVYGGGGVYPDVVLPALPQLPEWLAQLEENGIPIRWASAFATASPAKPGDTGALDDAAIAKFREFAQSLNSNVPASAEIDARLKQHLAPLVARQRSGDSAYYRALAASDPWVADAIASFDRAAALPGLRPR